MADLKSDLPAENSTKVSDTPVSFSIWNLNLKKLGFDLSGVVVN